jgi:Flp pilus assembly pilin Flp
MSVEYALMLVVITGAIAGLLGLGVTDSFKTTQCAIQSAITGQACGSGTGTPVGTGTPAGTGTPGGIQQPGGTGPTGVPTTEAPLPVDPSPSCTTTASHTEPSDCPTSTD